MRAWWMLTFIVVTLAAEIGVNSAAGHRQMMMWVGLLALAVVGLAYVINRMLQLRVPNVVPIHDRPSVLATLTKTLKS